MKLSTSFITKTATLAKLNLTPQVAQQYVQELDLILSHFSTLQMIDTTAVELKTQISGLQNVLREDVVQDYPAHSRQKLLAQSVEVIDGYIAVPHTILQHPKL